VIARSAHRLIFLLSLAHEALLHKTHINCVQIFNADDCLAFMIYFDANEVVNAFGVFASPFVINSRSPWLRL
jgi:hypothetical protein